MRPTFRNIKRIYSSTFGEATRMSAGRLDFFGAQFAIKNRFRFQFQVYYMDRSFILNQPIQTSWLQISLFFLTNHQLEKSKTFPVQDFIADQKHSRTPHIFRKTLPRDHLSPNKITLIIIIAHVDHQ